MEELTLDRKKDMNYRKRFYNLLQEYTKTNSWEQAVKSLTYIEEPIIIRPNERFVNVNQKDMETYPYKCLCGKSIKYVSIFYCEAISDYIIIGSVCIEHTGDTNQIPEFKKSLEHYKEQLKQSTKNKCLICEKFNITNIDYKNQICYDVCNKCRLNYKKFYCARCKNSVLYKNPLTYNICYFCNINQDKIYLNVKYHQKDEAKKFGAIWDTIGRKWFTTLNNTMLNDLLEKYGNHDA